MLQTIFRPKTKEVRGRRINMQNQQLHSFYCSSNIIMIINSRKIIRVDRKAVMGEINAN